MAGMVISEVAQHTGIPAATLRYYETMGLLSPQRSPNGYRRYEVDDVELLRFVSAAKRLGLRLTEIRTLLELRRDGGCRSVRRELAALVDAKARQTAETITALTAFADELTELGRRLGGPAPSRCGPGCGCPGETLHITPTAEREDTCRNGAR